VSGYSWFDIEIGGEDEPSPLHKTRTFQESDLLAEMPDTSSAFARAHSAEAAERMDKMFMSHGIEEDPPARTLTKRYAGSSGDVMTREFRKVLDEFDPGLRKLRSIAKAAVLEISQEEV